MSNERPFRKPTSPKHAQDSYVRIRSSETVRHSKERKERKKSRQRGITITLGSVAACLVAVNIQPLSDTIQATTTSTELNDELSDIASMLAGSSVHVHCDDERLDALDNANPIVENGTTYRRNGMVNPLRIPFGPSYSPPATTIREDICMTIADYNAEVPLVTSDSPEAQQYLTRTWYYADSLAILLHEIEHTQQIDSEAEANCYAYQKLPVALEQTGVDEATSEHIALSVAETIAQTAMASYVSTECRPDGAYDLGISNVYLTVAP